MISLKKVSDFRERYLWGWLPFWVYSALMIQGAIESPARLPRILFRFNDKILHGLEFFLLVWLALNAFRRAKSVRLRTAVMFYAFLYALIMGLVTEAVQFYAPGRAPEFWDFMADLGGAGAALLILILFKRQAGF